MAISLFDPWVRLSPVVHIAVFALLIVLGVSSVHTVLKADKQEARRLHWLRFVVMLPLLAVGLYQAGGDSARRLYVGFTPAYITPSPTMRLTVTITPPVYTGLKRTELANRVMMPSPALHAGQAITVSSGSMIVVTADQTRWPPSLVWGRSAATLHRQSNGSFQISGKIEADTKVEIRLGSKKLAGWPLIVRKDNPPTVRLVGTPGVTLRRSLKLHVEASDDFGVAYLALRLHPRNAPDAKDILVDIPAYGARQMDVFEYVNLVAHPLAGQTVVAHLVAVDAAGQEGVSQSVDITLPSTKFRNPLALSMAEARKYVLEGGTSLSLALQKLQNMSANSNEETADITTYLGIRTAYRRLENDPYGEKKDEIAALLWDLSLRAEDGGLTLARDDLHEALDGLRFVVNKRAPQADIEAMIGRFAWALRAFDESWQKAQLRPNLAPTARADLSEGLDWGALSKFLTKAQGLAAQKNYAELGETLDQLKAGLEDRGDMLLSAGAYRRFLLASYTRQSLADLRDEQQRLLEQSESAATKLSASVIRHQREDQKILRNAVVQLAQQLDKVGLGQFAAIDGARQAMEKALKALPRNVAPEIAGAQSEVIVALDLAARELSRVPSPMGPDWQGAAFDALGRPIPSFIIKTKGKDEPAVAASEK